MLALPLRCSVPRTAMAVIVAPLAIPQRRTVLQETLVRSVDARRHLSSNRRNIPRTQGGACPVRVHVHTQVVDLHFGTEAPARAGLTPEREDLAASSGVACHLGNFATPRALVCEVPVHVQSQLVRCLVEDQRHMPPRHVPVELVLRIDKVPWVLPNAGRLGVVPIEALVLQPEAPACAARRFRVGGTHLKEVDPARRHPPLTRDVAVPEGERHARAVEVRHACQVALVAFRKRGRGRQARRFLQQRVVLAAGARVRQQRIVGCNRARGERG
mmetsp:Transcript_18279/g.44098  ORF Transcript_18279/g.44098 Transcript_18279/m.44098 type:complete len:272 (-) Transcript_18279:371-1186(-)